MPRGDRRLFPGRFGIQVPRQLHGVVQHPANHQQGRLKAVDQEVARPADVMEGDLVVYEDGDGISHVAVVVSNEPRLADGSSIIRVISQWGSDGEYLHEYRDVPLLLGRPVRFYSERRKI